MGEGSDGRVAYIDNLKGVAIFLVVLGHIVTYDKDFHRLYNLIYAFHMPLFMFLAGCTTVISYGRRKATPKEYLCRRFGTIMVPYFAWAILLPLMVTRPFTVQTWNGILYKTFVSNRMYWFLPTLYGLIVLYVCYCRIGEWLRGRIGSRGGNGSRGENHRTGFMLDVASLLLVVCVLAACMFLTGYQLFRDMAGFVIPFFGAVFYMENEWVRKLFCHGISGLAAFVVFVLLLGRFEFDTASVTTSLLRMTLGMCAVVMLLQIFVKLRIPQAVGSQLTIWGRYSFLIYILHIQLLVKSGLSAVRFADRTQTLLWYCFVSIVVCYFGSLLAVVLGHIPILRTVLLGKRGERYGKNEAA